MLDPVDENAFQSVIDPIENAIIADPEAIPFFGRQLETVGGTGLQRQRADFLYDALEGRRFEPVEVLLRGRKDENVMRGAS
ncbi:MAG: hypothetical protein A2Y86_03385 [Candidatus Aminicenantes bacterium RBG_13_62_12]|nr:MAG: hypothetical protein A2Y86_03385 [Candidatus Aminicenantes bacterium RBG_13_62_12]